MPRVNLVALPEHALLQAYRSRARCYTDCYETVVTRSVTLEAFVFAFYTTWLFKVERVILRWFASKPSTDEQARALAAAATDSFAAWTVEGRAENQLLLTDFRRRTRSWLMVAPGRGATQLYFGSAVVPIADTRNGTPRLGAAFSLLLGFHKLYSRALLRLTARKLLRP